MGSPDEKNGCKRNARKACRGQNHLHASQNVESYDLSRVNMMQAAYMHDNFETGKFSELCEAHQFAHASFLSLPHTGEGLTDGLRNESLTNKYYLMNFLLIF